MSIRDYSRRLFCNIKWCGLRCNPSCLYSSTDKEWVINAFHAYQVPSVCLYPSGYLIVCLFMCLYVRVYNWKCTGLKIRIRSQMYGHLHELHFILYLTFTASLYDGKYTCFHMGVMGSIRRLIHGIARRMGASN